MPAAITTNSNRTWRLKHVVHVDRMWLQMRPAFLFTICRTDCRCDTWTAARRSRHQRHPPPSTLHGDSVTDKLGKRMPACQRDRPAVEIWHTDLQHWLWQAYIMYSPHVQSSDAALQADHIGLSPSPTNAHIKLPLHSHLTAQWKCLSDLCSLERRQPAVRRRVLCGHVWR